MRWCAAFALSFASVAASGCPATAQDGELVSADAITLAWQATPRSIVVGKPFTLQLVLCPAEAQLVAVDATMPDHRHGMNYRPSLKALGGGRWRADGLLWHMSGRWQLRFDVQQGAARQTLTRDVVLP
jgi:hypothetical protein